MDFDETRLYYSHQQLHSKNTTTTTTFNHDDEDDDDGNDISDPLILSNDNNDETQLPVDAMRRHFREFFRKYEYGVLLIDYFGQLVIMCSFLDP
jgi:hypothetical protein